MRTSRCRSILWPSKVKLTSSTPRRSAQAPNAASAPGAPPLKRMLSAAVMAWDHSIAVTSPRVYFFFSSRRRHTRFDCDWSSDVCSSDLQRRLALRRLASEAHADFDARLAEELSRLVHGAGVFDHEARGSRRVAAFDAGEEIGRASCRERV